MNEITVNQMRNERQDLSKNILAENKILTLSEPIEPASSGFLKSPKYKCIIRNKMKPQYTLSDRLTPMATLEMVLTTKEFQKIEELPKLPTDKKTRSVDGSQPVALNLLKPLPKGITVKPVTAAINLPERLPECTTAKPENTWKAKVENIRKTVKEKLKETLENGTEDYMKHDNKTSSCVVQTTQTTLRGFDTCGFIRRSKKSRTFSLTCFQCKAVYELQDWPQYVMHFDNVPHNYKRKTKVKSPLPTNNINSTSVVEMESTHIVSDTNSVSIEDNINIIRLENNVNNAPVEEINVLDSIDEIDDDTESMSCLENEDPTEENDGVIDFYKPNSARNLKFLKVLSAHPMLWYPRRYGPVKFDEETEKFLIKFDSSMAIPDFHGSLINARELQRRFNVMTPAKESKLAKEPQLQEYVDLLNNIANLSKSYAYTCDCCSYFFLDENDLFKHKFKKHKVGDLSHICSCGLHFADSKGKEAHEATHNTEPIFTCEHCGLSFFSMRKLQNHIVLNHPDALPNSKPHQCPKCDERFAQKYMLKWHILKHDPPRYKCETCGKTYRKAFEYNHHIKGHLNQRDFICEECGKSYIGKYMLKRHLLKVHKTGEHVCAPCKQYFANHENLHAHMQKFHPNGANADRKKKLHAKHVKKYHDRLRTARPSSGPARKQRNFRCKQCGSVFEGFGEFRKHKQEFGHFLGERRYKCPHCESILNSDQTFVLHLRRLHHLNTKYSDIKYFQPYISNSDEFSVIVSEETDANAQYADDACEETKYAVHNLNYAAESNKSDVNRSIAKTAIANYEEVQYTDIPIVEENSAFFDDCHNEFKIENESIQF